MTLFALISLLFLSVIQAGLLIWLVVWLRQRLTPEIFHVEATPLKNLSFAEAKDLPTLIDSMRRAVSQSATQSLATSNGNVRVALRPSFSKAIVANADTIELALDITNEYGVPLFNTSDLRVKIQRGIKELYSAIQSDQMQAVIDYLKTNVPELLSKVPDLFTGFLSVAHYLSGLDNARKLESITRQLNLIHEHRSIDKEARIERIYASSAAAVKVGGLKSEIANRLTVYQDELYELRVQARLEIAGTLKESLSVDRRRWWWKLTGETEDHFLQQLAACRAHFELIIFAFLLELCIAETLESRNAFFHYRAKEEVLQIRATVVNTDGLGICQNAAVAEQRKIVRNTLNDLGSWMTALSNSGIAPEGGTQIRRTSSSLFVRTARGMRRLSTLWSRVRRPGRRIWQWGRRVQGRSWDGAGRGAFG
jgi:hypothetical protein